MRLKLHYIPLLRASPRHLITLGVAAGVLACGGDSIVALSASERNRRISALVGDRIQITLQTVGPGEYASPPALSSPAIVFLDSTECGEPVPAGATQCFHFRAAHPGEAVISFTHTGNNLPVQDTVDVR